MKVWQTATTPPEPEQSDQLILWNGRMLSGFYNNGKWYDDYEVLVTGVTHWMKVEPPIPDTQKP